MSKIPQGEWNAIAARYQGGESISKIARSYGCTPPAIHYILKRNRQKPGEILAQPMMAAAPQTGLVRAYAIQSPVASIGDGESAEGAPMRSAPARANAAEPAPAAARDAPEASPSQAPRAPDAAPTLGLRTNNFATAGARPVMIRAAAEPTPVRTSAPEASANAQPLLRPTRNPITASAPTPVPAFARLKDVGRTPNHQVAPPGAAQSEALPGLPGLDDELHLRAEAAIALFRSSFDAALAEGSPGVREQLRQAASDLMRVAARTTIVLDRLNANSERTSRTHNYPRSAHAGGDLSKFG